MVDASLPPPAIKKTKRYKIPTGNWL